MITGKLTSISTFASPTFHFISFHDRTHVCRALSNYLNSKFLQCIKIRIRASHRYIFVCTEGRSRFTFRNFLCRSSFFTLRWQQLLFTVRRSRAHWKSHHKLPAHPKIHREPSGQIFRRMERRLRSRDLCAWPRSRSFYALPLAGRSYEWMSIFGTWKKIDTKIGHLF